MLIVLEVRSFSSDGLIAAALNARAAMINSATNKFFLTSPFLLSCLDNGGSNEKLFGS
jgi:hypothetical protein